MAGVASLPRRTVAPRPRASVRGLNHCSTCRRSRARTVRDVAMRSGCQSDRTSRLLPAWYVDLPVRRRTDVRRIRRFGVELEDGPARPARPSGRVDVFSRFRSRRTPIRDMGRLGSAGTTESASHRSDPSARKVRTGRGRHPASVFLVAARGGSLGIEQEWEGTAPDIGWSVAPLPTVQEDTFIHVRPKVVMPAEFANRPGRFRCHRKSFWLNADYVEHIRGHRPRQR